MNGEFEWRLRYYSRTGNADLYGDAGVQDSRPLSLFESFSAYAAPGGVLPATATGPDYGQTQLGAIPAAAYPSGYVGFSGPNIYKTGFTGSAAAPMPVVADDSTGGRVAITRGGFSRWGCDAMYNDMKLTMVPTIRVNNAIRVHGVYTIGGFRNKYVQTNRDAQYELSPGVPPYERYYMSLSSMSAYNTAALGSWEQLRATVQMPIATMSIGIKDFPFGTGARFSQNTRSDTFVMIVPYGPMRFIYGAWLMEGSPVNFATSWLTMPDKDTKSTVFQGLLIDVNQGPLNFGVGYIYNMSHLNAFQSTYIIPAASFGGAGVRGMDIVFQQYDVAMKYNNGRFFLNAEYYWQTRDYNRLGAFPISREGYFFFSEGGILAGPAKLSLTYMQASGRPRHDTAGYDNRSKVGIAQAINYQVIEPYSFLMFPTYGGGNNTFNADGTGELSDAIALGGRLDYAVASNLNLFGTFLYARRLERDGDYAGSYNTGLNAGGTASFTASTNIATAQAWKAVATGNAAAGLNPYVDDNLIGWEAQGGLSWKLLEGLTMNAVYSYWQPGEWFNQAYRAVTGADLGLIGADMWMNQRSAIHSARGSFVIDF